MSITFNLELDYKANKKGEKLLMIRCSQHGNHKRINTGIHIEPKHWDKLLKKVKKSHPLYLEMNKTLSKKLTEFEEIHIALLDKNEEVYLDEIISKYQKPKSLSFYDFAYKTKLAHFKANKKMGTYRRYEAVLNKLKEFTGNNLSLKQIDYQFLKEFENHLLLEKKNGRDTVSSNLSVIRSILNEAIKHDLFEKKNPFDSITLQYTNNTKSKLTIEELKVFSNVQLPNIPSLHLAKDFFMACFYGAGCRGGDMVTMKWENVQGEYFIYQQQKTGKKMVLPLLPELKLIFEKYQSHSQYIFPLLKDNENVDERAINSKLTYINKYLKEVCKYANIFKKISSHCARHTFSDISLSLNENDVYGLREVLGHSSVKTTEGYLINRNYSKSIEYLQSIGKLLE